MLKKSFLHEYQLAIGQILENDSLIHTTFFYDVRFTKNEEIKVHCQNCFCYNSCCCSKPSDKVDSNYNNELEQLTSDYKECFFKAKLDQIFDTQAYKILNNDSTLVCPPDESEEYQPFELVTKPVEQPLINDDPDPVYPKVHVYAPVAKYPNEEYYQIIQNQNQEYEQLSSPQEYQQPSQNIELEEQFFIPATAGYQQSSEYHSDQSNQYATPAYQSITQHYTPVNQLNHINSSAFDQINLSTVPAQQQQDHHQIHVVEQPSQLPVYHEYNQNDTQHLMQNITAINQDQTHSSKVTLDNLSAKLLNKVPDNDNNTQTSINRSAYALFLNKKRQRTIELQDISPPQKYSKLSIFHSVSSMSRAAN